ncbi:hypothetical protein AB0G66_13405 [Streptomyces lydicus]
MASSTLHRRADGNGSSCGRPERIGRLLVVLLVVVRGPSEGVGDLAALPLDVTESIMPTLQRPHELAGELETPGLPGHSLMLSTQISDGSAHPGLHLFAMPGSGSERIWIYFDTRHDSPDPRFFLLFRPSTGI